jgi:type I restriction enzyme S subunit
LATRVNDVQRLLEEAENESELLLRSILADTSDGKPSLMPMHELVTLREPDVAVSPQNFYHFAGVYSFGRGVFRGINKKGNQFAYTKLTSLRTNNFVYPKLMAWEGAYGIVPPECDGLVVSPEFPVFELNQEKILPETMAVYFRMSTTWQTLSGQSVGTNVRRRRLNPKTFLIYQFPLPPMKRQLLLREVYTRVNELRDKHSKMQKELDALLPSILNRAFRGKL